MFNCKRPRLDQLNIDYKYAFSFNDCLCNIEQKLFAVNVQIVAMMLLVLPEIILQASFVRVIRLIKI